MIAVDPRLISHGTLVYLWPNPFAWKGPFLAADTGGAIQGRRIDFYDWRGRLAQYRWGHRHTTASPTPRHDDAPVVDDLELVADTCAATDDGSDRLSPEALALPGVRGRVRVAPLAERARPAGTPRAARVPRARGRDRRARDRAHHRHQPR